MAKKFTGIRLIFNKNEETLWLHLYVTEGSLFCILIGITLKNIETKNQTEKFNKLKKNTKRSRNNLLTQTNL